jgi:hypothetical protein
MKKLLALYKSSLRIWAAFIALFAYGVVEFAAPQLPGALEGEATKLILSLGTLGLVFAAGEVVIRKWLWRKNIFNNYIRMFLYEDIDYQGLWIGETFYTNCELKDDE